jgi:6-phosphofructokinase 2
MGSAPLVSVQSKVGAGDSMVAGLIKGLLEQAPLETVLKMGIAAGTAAVMTTGAELCHRQDYETLLPQVMVQVLSV